MNAKTICPTAEVQRTTVGAGRYCSEASAAVLPLLVEHSQISGPGGQRLVSVIQWTIVELFCTICTTPRPSI
jgi:hypothetical protein